MCIKDWGVEQENGPEDWVSVWVNAWMMVKREERGVIVSSIFEDLYWQIQQTLKAHYGGRSATQKDVESTRFDKTFIFKPPLVKVLYVISHCRISVHPEGQTKQQSNNFLDHYKKKGLSYLLWKVRFLNSDCCYPPQALCLAYTFHIFSVARPCG